MLINGYTYDKWSHKELNLIVVMSNKSRVLCSINCKNKNQIFKNFNNNINYMTGKKMEKKFSNIISPDKFIFLSIISLGLYELVWFHRNWKFFKEKEKLNISPKWRAIFAVLFIYPLFKKMLEYAKKEGYKEEYSSGWRTFFWFILALLGRAENFVFLLSIFTFLPLLSPLDAINFYYNKKEQNCAKRTLKWWHILLITLCVIFWIFVLIGLLVLEV